MIFLNKEERIQNIWLTSMSTCNNLIASTRIVYYTFFINKDIYYSYHSK